MPWIIQLDDGRDLNAVGEIDGLRDTEIRRISLILDGDHFNRDEIGSVIARCKIPRSKGAVKSALEPVCIEIERALNAGEFTFDLFRQISGWFNTPKNGGDQLEEIIKRLFYGAVFPRFTEQDNQKLVDNFRRIFLPWLEQVFLADQEHRGG
jgi:hypothetical protein